MCTQTTAVPLLTVAPTQRELGGLSNANERTRASVIGIGRNSGELLAGLLDTAPCRLLYLLGYAGALEPHLHPGELVVGELILAWFKRRCPRRSHATRAAMLLRESGLSILEGAVLTVDEPLLTPLAKRRAYNGSGALVVDMEGRWIADVAASRDIPLIGHPCCTGRSLLSSPCLHLNNHC